MGGWLDHVKISKTLRIRVGMRYVVAWGLLITKLFLFLKLLSKNRSRSPFEVYQVEVHYNAPSQHRDWTDIILSMMLCLHKI